MAVCCVIRPPHRLGGVAKSRSLFVATPPLILAPLDEMSRTVETGNNGGLSGAKKPSVFYLTGQVVAAHRGRERIYAFPTRDFGGPRKTGFRKAQLASGPF